MKNSSVKVAKVNFTSIISLGKLFIANSVIRNRTRKLYTPKVFINNSIKLDEPNKSISYTDDNISTIQIPKITTSFPFDYNINNELKINMDRILNEISSEELTSKLNYFDQKKNRNHKKHKHSNPIYQNLDLSFREWNTIVGRNYRIVIGILIITLSLMLCILIFIITLKNII